MTRREYTDTLTRELEEHGVSHWTLETDHKHPRLLFEMHGKPLVYVIPSTPSDNRGHLNALSDLRRLMGVKRVVRKSASHPKRRCVVQGATLPELLTLVERPDPFASLVLVKSNIALAVKAARWSGQAAFHAGLTGVAPANMPPHIAKAFLSGWWGAHGKRGY